MSFGNNQNSSLVTGIDNFETHAIGTSLSKFSLWSNCNASVSFTTSADKFQGSKSARIFVQSCDQGGWITSTYTMQYSHRDWSEKSGFRVKIQTDRKISLSLTFTDKSNEPWVLNPSASVVFTKSYNNSNYVTQSTKGLIEFSKGFEGEVLIPFSALKVADWYIGAKNNIFETSEIKSVAFGFSSNGSANTSLYIDEISVYWASGFPSKLEIMGIEKAYTPLKEYDYIRLTPLLKNDMGLPIEPMGLNWDITPGGSGLLVDNDGNVTISTAAIETEYTITATPSTDISLYAEHKLTVSSKNAYMQSVYNRLNNRNFPSVHMAWNGIDDGSVVRNSVEDKAKHDLFWHNPNAFGLVWQKINGYEGLANSFTINSTNNANIQRQLLLQKNPDMLLFGCVTWIEKSLDYLPDNHEWWMRDGLGNKIKGWGEGNYQSYLLDTSNESYQDSVVAKAKAIATCGVFDGLMIDCWNDSPDYVRLLQKIRTAIGNDIMIIVNSNMYEIPNSAQYVNGLFMESYKATTADDWRLIENTLAWAETSLRMPRVNNLETWAEVSRTNPADLKKMRATTTLALTRSNGFCLFADDNKLPVGDHMHNFYDFWVKRLGKTKGEGFKRMDGAWERSFDNGIAIYNPIGNQQIDVVFTKPYQSISTGVISTSHTVSGYDGDLFISTGSTTVNEINRSFQVEIFPIPVKDVLNINCISGNNPEISLYDVSGRKVVYKKALSKHQLYMGDMCPGIYLLELSCDNTKEKHIQRIVKSH